VNDVLPPLASGTAARATIDENPLESEIWNSYVFAAPVAVTLAIANVGRNDAAEAPSAGEVSDGTSWVELGEVGESLPPHAASAVAAYSMTVAKCRNRRTISSLQGLSGE
jgi:hypothetical protein